MAGWGEPQLEPEHEELLARMVEATRAVPRPKRHPFVLLQTADGTALLLHDGLKGDTQPPKSDLEDLADGGLLRRGFSKKGTPNYQVTQAGFAHYERLKGERAGQLEQVEDEVRRYLEGDRLSGVYAAAAGKWAEADKLLWSADTERQLTTIGHLCREAMQGFAQALVKRLEPPEAKALPADPAKTVARIRACLAQLRMRMGGAEAAWLDALLTYWGTTSDLAQRQEHGAGKESEELRWEDARRLVFHTALVMYELARAADRPRT